MNVALCSSVTACRNSSWVFMTIGPYHDTGSSIGLPDTHPIPVMVNLNQPHRYITGGEARIECNRLLRAFAWATKSLCALDEGVAGHGFQHLTVVPTLKRSSDPAFVGVLMRG